MFGVFTFSFVLVWCISFWVLFVARSGLVLTFANRLKCYIWPGSHRLKTTCVDEKGLEIKQYVWRTKHDNFFKSLASRMTPSLPPRPPPTGTNRPQTFLVFVLAAFFQVSQTELLLSWMFKKTILVCFDFSPTFNSTYPVTQHISVHHTPPKIATTPTPDPFPAPINVSTHQLQAANSCAAKMKTFT